MRLAAIRKPTRRDDRRRRDALDASDIQRAVNALIETQGTCTGALRVAMQRANNAELSGATEAAYTWKRIADVIQRATRPIAPA
jgi:hypothetical protein